MAITEFGGAIPFPGVMYRQAGVSASGLTIDADTERAAAVFQAPKTGTISKVGFRTGNVATGATVDVRLETVDAANGDPTGTLWGTDTNASQVIGNGDDNTWFLTTLTAGAAVTKGDILARVIANGTGGNIEIDHLVNTSGGSFPYLDLFTAAWAKSSQVAPILALEYNDGSYEWASGVLPIATATGATFNSGSTPDERGNIFSSFPFKARVTGCWVSIDADNASEIRLYQVGNDTPLATHTILAGQRGGTAQSVHHILFSSAVDLFRGQSYRLAVRPTTASNIILHQVTVSTAAIMAAMTGGTNIHLTTRTDGATTGGTLNDGWTQTTTARFLMGLYISGFDV